MRYEPKSSSDSASKTLERFFRGFAEYIFHARLGIADTELVGYVGDLLIRFTKTDAMHRMRQLQGKTAVEMVGMLAKAQQRIGMAKREVHRHIGDFTLFWTGLYPEALRESAGPGQRDQFASFCHQGKRAYEIASEIEPDSEMLTSSSLVKRMSAQLEMCAYGLREVRRQWESPDDQDSGGSLLIS
jgi:hypothetical protein